jgi:hypothetical protein
MDHEMGNGGFIAGYADWDVTGTGSVQIANYPGASNSVAKMVTGSPVSLSQKLDTLPSAFYLLFDCDFAQDDGWISVYLNGVHLGDVSGQYGQLMPCQFEVDDASLLGVSAAELRFTMDASGSGWIGYLDNVRLEPVPEPAAISLLLVGALMMRRRHTRPSPACLQRRGCTNSLNRLSGR